MTHRIVTSDDLEAFTGDLIKLFNKHHLAILFEYPKIVIIDTDYHVTHLLRATVENQELIVPAFSKANLDEIIHVEDDNGL